MARSYPHNKGRHAVREGRDDAYQCSWRCNHVMLSRADGASEAVLRFSTRVHDKTMPSTLRSVDDDVLGVICAILDKNELKQISLVDKRLRGISLPLLFQRVHMQSVWKLATDAIEGMLASTAFDIVAGNTRCDS